MDTTLKTSFLQCTTLYQRFYTACLVYMALKSFLQKSPFFFLSYSFFNIWSTLSVELLLKFLTLQMQANTRFKFSHFGDFWKSHCSMASIFGQKLATLCLSSSQQHLKSKTSMRCIALVSRVLWLLQHPYFLETQVLAPLLLKRKAIQHPKNSKKHEQHPQF